MSVVAANNQPDESNRFYSCVENLLAIAGDASNELQLKGINGISGGIMAIAKAYLAGRDRRELIQLFIDKGHEECWGKVSVKDDDFFLNNAERLFGKIRGFDLNIFQDVFRKDANGKFLLSQELIDDVWITLDAMIRISIKYIHVNRGPGQVEVAGQEYKENCYYSVFYDTVNLEAHAKTWGMELKFTKE